MLGNKTASFSCLLALHPQVEVIFHIVECFSCFAMVIISWLKEHGLCDYAKQTCSRLKNNFQPNLFILGWEIQTHLNIFLQPSQKVRVYCVSKDACALVGSLNLKQIDNIVIICHTLDNTNRNSMQSIMLHINPQGFPPPTPPQYIECMPTLCMEGHGLESFRVSILIFVPLSLDCEQSLLFLFRHSKSRARVRGEWRSCDSAF